MAIGCSLGTVFHTGDWKFDPSPLIGPPTDVEALKRYVHSIIGPASASLRVSQHDSGPGCVQLNSIVHPYCRIGEENVIALIGDSTNATEEVCCRLRFHPSDLIITKASLRT